MRAVSRPTILFSTTRSWNPGDEFILFGIEALLVPLCGAFNPVIYNRHPDLHLPRILLDRSVNLKKGQQTVTINPYEILRSRIPNLHDNSWRGLFDLGLFDLVVFAGTPEWMGAMVEPLTAALGESAVPVIHLGLGGFDNIAAWGPENLPPADRRVLERSRLVTVRDGVAERILAPYGPERLPCPALFSAPRHRKRERLHRIALSLQGTSPQNGQRIRPQVFKYAQALFERLAERYECGLVCHYVDELHELRHAFGDRIDTYYAYDARDYAALYDGFDLTVTTRVHGAGLCASMGVPGFVISHSARTETTEGFMAEVIDPSTERLDAVIARIGALDLAQRSAGLAVHKEATRRRYTALLEPVLDTLGLLAR